MAGPADPLRRILGRMFGWSGIVVALDTAASELESRLRSAGVPANSESDTAYRTMVLNASGLVQHACAVVIRPEDLDPTTRSQAAHALRARGVLVGVRMDTGWEEITSTWDLVTSGLDGLRSRLTWSRDRGATLALWSVCTTTNAGGLAALTANSQAAARFARTCQSVGVLPVLRIGSRMPAGSPGCRRGSLAAALLSVTGHLADLEVDLGAVVINTTHEPEPGIDPLGRRVLDALPHDLGGVVLGARRTVGPACPGHDVAGDLGELAAACVPTWPVSFYLGREVTLPALRAWRGSRSRTEAGQKVLESGLAVASTALRRATGRAGSDTSLSYRRADVVLPAFGSTLRAVPDPWEAGIRG